MVIDKQARLQQSCFQAASSWSVSADAIRYSRDEGLDDGSCSSDASDRDFPSLNSCGQSERNQPKHLFTRASASDTSGYDRLSPAQLKPPLGLCSECVQYRLNEVERDELFNEIHELRDQVNFSICHIFA